MSKSSRRHVWALSGCLAVWSAIPRSVSAQEAPEEHAEEGKAAAEKLNEEPAEGAGASDESSSSESETVVQFTADHPNATLEVHQQAADADERWRSLCIAPCKQRLAAESALRVNGDGIIPSDSFYLPENRAEVEVRAEAATRGARTLAAVMAVGGGVLFLNGAGLTLAGSLLDSEAGDAAGAGPDGSTLVVVGSVAMVVGCTVGIIGLVNLLGNETTVHVAKNAPDDRLQLADGLELSGQGLHF